MQKTLFLSICYLLLGSLPGTLCLAADPVVQKTGGSIEGVPYEIAWKAGEPFPNRVVLYCHGYIPAEFPVKAYLPAGKEPYRTFIEEGWAVAASAYRRNGIIIHDAMLDTLALLDAVEEDYSPPDQVLLLGSSMGGAVSLLLLEGHPDRFAGALILGRGLELREKEEGVPFNHLPEDPIVMLTNRTEREAPQAYRDAVEPENPYRPALWVVQTDGHIHFTNGEYREAVYGLLDWVAESRRKPAPEKLFHIPPQIPATGAVFNADFSQVVTEISDTNPTYGNVELQLSEEDLARLGLQLGDRFILEIVQTGKLYEVPWVTTYNDVGVGQLLAFINEFGLLQVAINFEHFAHKSGLDLGDAVVLRALK